MVHSLEGGAEFAAGSEEEVSDASLHKKEIGITLRPNICRCAPTPAAGGTGRIGGYRCPGARPLGGEFGVLVHKFSITGNRVVDAYPVHVLCLS